MHADLSNLLRLVAAGLKIIERSSVFALASIQEATFFLVTANRGRLSDLVNELFICLTRHCCTVIRTTVHISGRYVVRVSYTCVFSFYRFLRPTTGGAVNILHPFPKFRFMLLSYMHRAIEPGTFDPIYALRSVEVINLSSNILSGNISDLIGSLTTLQQLFLSDNKLTGDRRPRRSPYPRMGNTSATA